MPANSRRFSVHLDARATQRLTKAAALLDQSPAAFLAKAGDALARRILLDWAVAHYCDGERTFGELAEETGLAIEEIMDAFGRRGREAALDVSLENCGAIAHQYDDQAFRRLAEQVVEQVRAES